MSSSSKGRRTPTRTPAAAPAGAPPKPGLFASRGEKALYKLIKSGSFTVADLEAIAREHPDQWLAASTIAGLQRAANGDSGEAAVTQLRHVFEHRNPPEDDAFISRYMAGASSMRINIAPAVSVQLPFSRDVVGLTLAEVHQSREEIADAVDVVERVTPTAHAAVSLAELYSEAGRHNDVVDLTNNVTNEDDTTALLLVYRGIAFTRQGLYEAAREAFKEALKSKKRTAEIRHLALRHRAECYVADGQKAQARKDLERILAEDGSGPGVRDRLEQLTAS